MTTTPRICNGSYKTAASWEMHGERITCPECDKRVQVRKNGQYATHTEPVWMAKQRAAETTAK